MPSESAFPCRDSWEPKRSLDIGRNTPTPPLSLLWYPPAGNSRYLSSVLPIYWDLTNPGPHVREMSVVITNIPRYIFYMLFRSFFVLPHSRISPSSLSISRLFTVQFVVHTSSQNATRESIDFHRPNFARHRRHRRDYVQSSLREYHAVSS